MLAIGSPRAVVGPELTVSVCTTIFVFLPVVIALVPP